MSVLDEIRKLDEKKAELLAAAKSEALAAANEAVANLNELGFSYQLVEGSAPAGKRRTGIRDDVLNAVKKSPNGLKRAEVLDAINAHDKSAQQSVSNALSALKKAGALTLTEGVYTAT